MVKGDVPSIPKIRDNGDGPLEIFHFWDASQKGILLKDLYIKSIIYKFY